MPLLSSSTPEPRAPARQVRLRGGRIATHSILALLALLGAGVLTNYAPQFGPGRLLTLWYGYLSLLLLAVTLLIGPIALLSRWVKINSLRRAVRNRVNLDLRRDIGIWCAVTGCLHIYYAVGTHVGGNLLLYFFTPTPGSYVPLLTLFGVSNYLGLFAGLLLLLLLVISNDISLRYLKGKRWKLLQRSNYFLFLLTLAHTFGYQALTLREPAFPTSTLLLTVIVALVQSSGIWIYVRTRSRGANVRN